MEVGVKESFNKKLASGRLTWAGHVERMGNEKLAKRTDVQKVGDKRRRGRPKLRWEIALKETWKEWEKNGGKEEQTEGIKDCW